MVCKKCEELTRTELACPQVFGSQSKDNAPRKIGENKLLSAKKRYSPYASGIPAGWDRSGGTKAVAGSSSSVQGGKDKTKAVPESTAGPRRATVGPSRDSKKAGTAASSSAGVIGKCQVCRSNVSKPGASYCLGCAYKKGICSMCGVQILDTTSYKQSSK